MKKLHANEVTINTKIVQQLIASQFPEYAGQSVRAVPSSGTDNVIYRLGSELAVRLPRTVDKEQNLKKEYAWLPKIAPHVSMAVPTPVALGEPDDTYPLQWAIYDWLAGEPVSETKLADIDQAAVALAEFIQTLQKIDTTEAPQPRGDYDRGVPLIRRDQHTRTAIAAIKHMYDPEKLNAEWQASLDASPWSEQPLWIHGDLDGRNMLAKEGTLYAVIDFGSVGVGDPAYDVMVAWKIFSGKSRDVFRGHLQVDDATWTRSRGLVLSQAAMILSYYTEESNPVLVSEARNWMTELGL